MALPSQSTKQVFSLVDNSKAKLNDAIRQVNIAEIVESIAILGAGIFQRSIRQITVRGAVDAIARIWVIQDVER